MNYSYARVSNKNLSFDNQNNAISSYAQKNHISIDRQINEISNGFEMKDDNELYKLIRQLSKNDCLLCYNISRISRSFEKLYEFYNIVNQNNIRILFVNNSTEERIIREAPISLSVILSNITEIEAEYISIITKNALSELKKKGIILGRRVSIDSDTKEKIKEYYKNGHTTRETAEYFNVSPATVGRAVRGRNTKGENFDVSNIPLETRLLIWADKKIGKTNKELAQLYNVEEQYIDDIIKFLRGGGNW